MYPDHSRIQHGSLFMIILMVNNGKMMMGNADTNSSEKSFFNWENYPVPSIPSIPYSYCDSELPSVDTFKKPGGEDVKLESIHIFHRHGDRTPIQTLPFEDDVTWRCEGPQDMIYQNEHISTGTTNDEIMQESLLYSMDYGQSVGLKKVVYVDQQDAKEHGYWKGNCGAGVLTSKGQKQMYRLGKRFKEIYFSENRQSMVQWNSNSIPNASEFKIRSTDVGRTIQSVHNLLNGIFHHQKDNKPQFDVQVSPKPIDPFAVDMMNQKSLKEEQTKLLKDSIIETWQEDSEKIERRVRELLGMPKISLWEIFDNSKTRLCHGKPLPCHSGNKSSCLTEQDIEFVFKMVEWKTWIKFGLGNLNKARAGMFLKEVLKNMRQPDSNRVFVYSSHDTTMMALLGAYDVDDLRWPSYASSVVLETWKRSKNKKNRTHAKNFNREKETFVRLVKDGQPMKIACGSVSITNDIGIINYINSRFSNDHENDRGQYGYECPLDDFLKRTQKIADFSRNSSQYT